MPAILTQLFICSWKRHEWKELRMGLARPVHYCTRCSAIQGDWQDAYRLCLFIAGLLLVLYGLSWGAIIVDLACRFLLSQ